MRRFRATVVGLVMAVSGLGLAWPPVGATSPNGATGAGDEWPMYGGGFTHAGTSQAVGPSSPATHWSLSPKPIGWDEGTSPVVGSDGTIYLLQESGTYSFRLSAISPSTHKVLWSGSGAGDPNAGTPAVAPDGVVYVPIDGRGAVHGLYAFKKGGAKLWERTISQNHGFDPFGDPTIGPDGTVYVEDSRSVVYALNPKNGQLYWKFVGAPGGIGEYATPALSPDGTTMYLSSGSGDLYALAAGRAGGQLAWTYHIQGPKGGSIDGAPAVGPNGTIYVATSGGDGNTPADIEAVNPDGTSKWVYVSNGSFETTPTVTVTGQVVAGNDVGTVDAIRRSNGTLAWSYAAPGNFGENGFVAPAVSDADGTIYVQNQLGLFALDSEGSLQWSVTRDANVFAAPAMDDSGTLFATKESHSLIAYETGG
jgi:outer membrane protein assembly factor BamB